MSARSILFTGATGLIGGLTLRRLLADPGFTGTVFAPMRRAAQVSDARLIAPITDFASAGDDIALREAIRSAPSHRLDAFVSCLGTTIKTAGSRGAFIAVDRELVLRLAQLAFDEGARHAILVSSAGASRQSGNFYLRVKGEVEDALGRIGFDRLDILQPGLLLGQRSEQRPGEKLAQLLAPITNPALLGKLRRYRAVDADAVSAAIVRLLDCSDPGLFMHAYDSITRLSAPF
ncbi:MAG: NAD-dependent epimerase/dehydratase family protein [Arenimonas sp.]